MNPHTEGLRKVGSLYHYEFRLDGKRYHGSTRTGDLQEAMSMLLRMKADLLAPPPKQFTLKDAYTSWLETRGAEMSKTHLSSLASAFKRWLGPMLGDVPLVDIKDAGVLALRAKQLKAGLSPCYVNNVLKFLKLICNHAVRVGYISKLGFSVPKLRLQNKPRPVIPMNTWGLFLETFDRNTLSLHARVMIRVMLGMGLRESEVLGMRWEWLNETERTYTVGISKSHKYRVIPVPEWVMEALKTLPRGKSWVFPGRGTPTHRPQFGRRALERTLAALGMEGITHHRLRASFATAHAELGTSLPNIQELLGHADITTTRIYVETSMSSKKDAQAKLDVVMSGQKKAPVNARACRRWR